jgi:hypothetical protein
MHQVYSGCKEILNTGSQLHDCVHLYLVTSLDYSEIRFPS